MLFTLQNSHLRVALTDFGARLSAIEAPDRDGVFGHVLLGFDDPDSYRSAGGSFGAVLGRYANRIAHAQFWLDGQRHELAPDADGNILHGGAHGFGNRLWQLDGYSEQDQELRLSLRSPAWDEGFPGNVTATAVYRLRESTLTLELSAVTDAPTVINLSSHPYFNLGDPASDILDHEITINADHYLPTDPAQIPTGEFRPVAGSVFDFRAPTSFAERIRAPDPQLLMACGYDHCFVLNKSGPGLQFAARAFCPRSGRGLEVATTQPGLQLYSGNNLTGAVAGRSGALRQSAGFAMEAENFPNAPNQPEFPSTVLRPGEEYRQIIAYRFFTN